MHLVIAKTLAKNLWIQAQKLDIPAPFGRGTHATLSTIEHLGYVQIDTINVIERCHHHILFNRIPEYKKQDLYHCQSIDKTLFEYWTHALSYIPTKDYCFYAAAMKQFKLSPDPWLKHVTKKELNKILRDIKNHGAVSIRDIKDEILVKKIHPWASRKPAKHALQFGFYTGQLVISERIGMLKKYELTHRHFGWQKRPSPVSENALLEYLLERTLRTQALINLDSICYLNTKIKPAMNKLIEKKLRQNKLLPIKIKQLEKLPYYTTPEVVENISTMKPEFDFTHILSPFDPLIIQRKRLKLFFDFEYFFEAYVPKEKRKYGYFACPVLINDNIVAVIDLKTDRQQKELLVQQWSWLNHEKSTINKQKIEEALHHFEKFQLADLS